MPYKDKGKELAFKKRPDQMEKARVRTRRWIKEHPAQSRKSKHLYYLANREVLTQKMKEHARKYPHINKEAVAKWRAKNPGRDPVKYRVYGKLRERCNKIWRNECPICGRVFEDKGFLKRIFHHIRYEPIEHIVILCYQCHNLIHSRSCYSHPFLKLGGEESPELLAIAILQLREKYIVLHRLIPRKCGGSRKKESKIYLKEINNVTYL